MARIEKLYEKYFKEIDMDKFNWNKTNHVVSKNINTNIKYNIKCFNKLLEICYNENIYKLNEDYQNFKNNHNSFGVYALIDNGEILYIGKGIKVFNRCMNSLNAKNILISEKCCDNIVTDIKIYNTETKEDMDYLEEYMISKYSPKFNVSLTESTLYNSNFKNINIDIKDFDNYKILNISEVRELESDFYGGAYYEPLTNNLKIILKDNFIECFIKGSYIPHEKFGNYINDKSKLIYVCENKDINCERLSFKNIPILYKDKIIGVVLNKTKQIRECIYGNVFIMPKYSNMEFRIAEFIDNNIASLNFTNDLYGCGWTL